MIKKEKEEGNPAAPYDLFAQTRAYPDAVFDVKAFEDVMISASSQNKTTNVSSFGTWQIEGPTNIGGRITCVAVSPTNSNVILIGTPGAGMYKTTNGGTTWTPVFDNKPFLYIGAIAFDPNNANIVYAGTGDPDVPFTVFIGDGMYKSTDGGNTWASIGLTSTKIINKIVVNPSNSNEIYVAALGNPIIADNNRGVYKSTNGGTTWSQVLLINNQTGITDIEINPSNPQILYATSYTCIRNATVNIRYSNNARVYKEFTDGLKIGKCFLCGGQMNSFEEGRPCFHWFTYPTGIRKKLFENYLKNPIGFFQLDSYFRWLANTEKPIANINDLKDETSSTSYLETCLLYTSPSPRD